MKIYMIATIKDIQSRAEARAAGVFGCAEVYDSRTVGFAFTLEEAKEWVETNVCDIHEDLYKYAVIEGVSAGLYTSSATKSIWYKWSKSKKKYILIDKPVQLKQLAGFTIG